jgi:hypothetical protein
MALLMLFLLSWDRHADRHYTTLDAVAGEGVI